MNTNNVVVGMNCPNPLGSVSYKRPTDPMKQRFCFEQEGIIYRVKIERQNDELLYLRFVNELGNIVDVPEGAAVVDSNGIPSALLANNFLLIWLNSYVLLMHGVQILRLDNQRQNSIFGCSAVKKGFDFSQSGIVVPSMVLAEDAIIL